MPPADFKYKLPAHGKAYRKNKKPAWYAGFFVLRGRFRLYFRFFFALRFRGLCRSWRSYGRFFRAAYLAGFPVAIISNVKTAPFEHHTNRIDHPANLTITVRTNREWFITHTLSYVKLVVTSAASVWINWHFSYLPRYRLSYFFQRLILTAVFIFDNLTTHMLQTFC